VTACGNFAVIGFSDGQMVKFNMQSGRARKRFFMKKTKGIRWIFVDPYNKYLFAISNSNFLLLFDFF
jgi:hypothetical protein